jgi:hypothetical protein
MRSGDSRFWSCDFIAAAMSLFTRSVSVISDPDLNRRR